MKSKKTYVCNKCGYISISESNEELKQHVEEHSKTCDGILQIPKGRCNPEAFKRLIDNPSWLFCYGFIENKNKRYLHSWNESKGFLENINNQLRVETKNIQGKETKDFCLDYSDKENIEAVEKEVYYDFYKIKESEVKRLTLRQVLFNMLNCIDNNQDMWYWVI